MKLNANYESGTQFAFLVIGICIKCKIRLNIDEKHNIFLAFKYGGIDLLVCDVSISGITDLKSPNNENMCLTM